MKNINDITIGIVTFRQRATLVKKLIHQLRSYIPNEVNIILAVNGNNEEDMPESYRSDMLTLCSQYENIYPLICPEFKSLSKLWNTLVIFSKTEYNFILSDDVICDNSELLSILYNHVLSTKSEFFKINNQFSHFVLTKKILHTLGYFDERLIAHGNEDGDMVHRYIKLFGNRIPNIQIQGLYNLASYELRNEKMETFIHNKPTVNQKIHELKYKDDPNGICGMNPTPISYTGLLNDYQQYPYEMFFLNNKHNIAKFDKIILDE